MIEFLFAIALGVGSVVLATISIGNLVDRSNNHIIEIPADHVFNLITAENKDIYVNDKYIHNSGLFKSIDTDYGNIGYQTKSQNNKDGTQGTDFIMLMNKETNQSAEFRREINQTAYKGQSDDPAIIEAIEMLRQYDQQLNETHQPITHHKEIQL